MLECVPNFSEGTNQNIIEAIVSSVKSCPILDVHSDPDHNRTVATFTGEAKEVITAAFDLTKRAVELIDINSHTGVHPYIGAVDVIPFIPIKGTLMKEAVKAANDLGKKLWDELKLPVFFYGHAAKLAERENLANVRRGGFPAKGKPDIGEGSHPSAGAVAVGARDFLIAFNINLDSRDVEVAHLIAKNVREKRSGISGVKALGLYLKSRDMVQVSINLTDCVKTSLKDVFNEVKRWADECGVNIMESELVGMITPQAVFPGMEEYLKLKGFTKDKILSF